jgi:hypothetical protein
LVSSPTPTAAPSSAQPRTAGQSRVAIRSRRPPPGARGARGARARAAPPCPPDAQQGEEAERPPELVEHHRLEETARPEEERRRGHAQRREQLRPAPPAEFARQERGERHDRGVRQRREEPQQHRPVHHGVGAEHSGGLGGYRHERREVHGPEPQVLAHREVEQLVAVHAVG